MEVSRARILLQEIVASSYAELPSVIRLCVFGRWTRVLGGRTVFFFSSPFCGRIWARRDVVEAMPYEALRGVLAHELAHKVQFSNVGLWGRLRLIISWIASEKCRREIERGADEETIRRGFGTDLIALRRRGNEQYPARLKKAHLYLSPDEIEERMRAIRALKFLKFSK